MDMNVLRDKLVSTLGEKIVYLAHTGSRVRGEEKPESDYDLALIVSEIDRGTLDEIRDVLSDYSNISVYILDKKDLEYFPKAMCLQFVYSENLYGEYDFLKPSAEDIDVYVNMTRRNEIDTLRHYLTLPHDTSKLVGRIALSLKYAYICLTYLIYKEASVLPRTRIDTINHLKKKSSQRLGVALLQFLENWSTQEKIVIQNPRRFLHTLEEFWRFLEPNAIIEKP